MLSSSTIVSSSPLFPAKCQQERRKEKKTMMMRDDDIIIVAVALHTSFGNDP